MVDEETNNRSLTYPPSSRRMCCDGDGHTSKRRCVFFFLCIGCVLPLHLQDGMSSI